QADSPPLQVRKTPMSQSKQPATQRQSAYGDSRLNSSFLRRRAGRWRLVGPGRFPRCRLRTAKRWRQVSHAILWLRRIVDISIAVNEKTDQITRGNAKCQS